MLAFNHSVRLQYDSPGTGPAVLLAFAFIHNRSLRALLVAQSGPPPPHRATGP